MPEVPPQYQFAARISPLHTAVIGDATFVTPGFWSLLSVFIVPLPGFLGFLNRSGMAVNFAGTLWFSTVKQITELVSPSSESAHIKGGTTDGGLRSLFTCGEATQVNKSSFSSSSSFSQSSIFLPNYHFIPIYRLNQGCLGN